MKEAVITYARNKTYFSIDQLKSHLENQGINYSNESIKKYVYNLKNAGEIYDAGRGWYSNISQAFQLDKEPVKKIIDLVEKQFPLLSFSCWSTEQLRSYFHHLQAKFVTFVYSDRDYIPPIFEFLRENDFNAYLNPFQYEIKKSFLVEEDTIIIRPSITKAPSQDHFATIEKILVDLYVENEKLQLTEDWEFNNLFIEIISSQRISMASLLGYAIRRKVTDEIKSLLSKKGICDFEV